MRIYIASNFGRRKVLRDTLLPSLSRVGVHVTSSWISDDELDFHEIKDHKYHYAIAMRDLRDILESEVVVLDAVLPLNHGAGGGREFEAGFGLAKHGQFWLVGARRSPFHYKAELVWPTWQKFIDDFGRKNERTKQTGR